MALADRDLAHGTTAPRVTEELGAICSDCGFYAVGDKTLEEADAHHRDTQHRVRAQRKQTVTWEWI